MIGRAAAAVAQANKLIRALIILAQVICADETPIRVGPGPKTRKRYLLVACTRLLTCYFLGDRSLATFGAFVFPDLAGVVVVHDRYQNYDPSPASSTSFARLTCCVILPTRPKPTRVPSGRARSPMPCAGLSTPPTRRAARAWPPSPAASLPRLVPAFRHGVLAGLSEIPRRPGQPSYL